MADQVKSSVALDAAALAARVGSVVRGKWTIESFLGVGGMASVYAARHRNGKRVALKILHAHLAGDPSVCERFLREAYVSNKVNHSATVEVMDDDVTDDGEPFLVMDLLDGETVRDLWKKTGRTMPIGRVLQICERIADCLASCHAIGIIHRDLKPANVFITHDGEVKLIDFGVAQMRALANESSAVGTALGTPAYMSPEQAMGLVDQLDGRSDLFSLGAMLHALTTGHRINHGRNEQEALVMAASKPVPSVARVAPHLPPELVKTIDKSLSWDRRSRFRDAREMQAALLELMPAQGVAPLPARPAPRPHEVVAPPPPSLLGANSDATSSQVQSQVVATAASISTKAGASPSAFPGPEMIAAAPAAHAGMHWSSPPESSEDDSREAVLRRRMKPLDSVFASARRFGWSHETTELALHTCFEAWSDALEEDGASLEWALLPSGMASSDIPVWEPEAPSSSIPNALHAAGLRTLRVDAGLSLAELRSLLDTFLAENPDGAPAGLALATKLRGLSLRHVKFVFDPSIEAALSEAAHAETKDVEPPQPEIASNVAIVKSPPSSLSVPELSALLEVASEIEERGGHPKPRPPILLPEEPTAHGSLALTPIPHVLVYMLDHVLTGSVILEGLPGDNVIYFADGVPVKMYLSDPVVLLGEVFVNAGLISASEIERAVVAARKQDVLLGKYLVDRERITPEQLEWAVETQLLQNLTKIANLPESITYVYYGDIDVLSGIGDATFAPSSPLNPVLVSVRHWMDHARIHATLERVGSRALVLHHDAEIDRLALLPDEQLVLETIRHSQPSLVDLKMLGLAPDATVASLVYALTVTRQFEFAARTKGPMGLGARTKPASVPPESIQPIASVRPSVPSVPPSARASTLLAATPPSNPPSSAAPRSTPPTSNDNDRESREVPTRIGAMRPRAPAIRPIAAAAKSSSGTASPKPPQIRHTGAKKTTLLVRPKTASVPPDAASIDSGWGNSEPPPPASEPPRRPSGPPPHFHTTTRLRRDEIALAEAARQSSPSFGPNETQTKKHELLGDEPLLAGAIVSDDSPNE